MLITYRQYRYVIICIPVSVSTPGYIYVLFIWAFFRYPFHFQYNQSRNIIIIKTLVFWNIFVKNSPSGCCLAFAYFLANFSKMLLIKVLLIKKPVNSLKYHRRKRIKGSYKSRQGRKKQHCNIIFKSKTYNITTNKWKCNSSSSWFTC